MGVVQSTYGLDLEVGGVRIISIETLAHNIKYIYVVERFINMAIPINPFLATFYCSNVDPLNTRGNLLYKLTRQEWY